MTAEEAVAAAIKALIAEMSISQDELDAKIAQAIDAKLAKIATLLWSEKPLP